MKEELLHILQHSLGVDRQGRKKYGSPNSSEGRESYYRNRFATNAESPDGLLCLELCRMGLMKRNGASYLCGWMDVFHVTTGGIKAMEENSPKPPKLTRGQRRYRAWLESESSLPFFEWVEWRSTPECIERYGRIDA